MVTAHGASERALASTRALGLDVVEATCPLVHVAHRAVAALSETAITRSSSASATTWKCGV